MSNINYTKIRSQGPVIKFAAPAQPLRYNWTDFMKSFVPNKFNTASSDTSVAWQNDGKTQAEQLQESQGYQDFTNYIYNSDPTKSPEILAYLKELDRLAGNNKLFDANGNLQQSWNETFKHFREDNKMGYYHLTPTLLTATSSNGDSNLNGGKTQPSSSVGSGGKGTKFGSIGTNFEEVDTEDKKTNFVTLQRSPEESQYKGNKFIYPAIVHGANLGNNLFTAQRLYDAELEKKVPLQQAPYKQGILTNEAFTTGQVYQNEATKLQDQATRAASGTSSAEMANDILLEGNKQASQTRMQGAMHQANAYGQSAQNINNIVNENAYNSTATGNANINNLVAGHNAKITAKQQRDARIGEAFQQYANDMNADWQKYSLSEQMNQDQFLKEKNLSNYQLDLQEAGKTYTSIYSDPMKSKAFLDIYNKAYSDFTKNSGNSSWYNQNKDWASIFTAEKGTPIAELQAKYYQYLKDHPDAAGDFNAAYTTELNKEQEKYQQEALRLKELYDSANAFFPLQYSTAGWFGYDPNKDNRIYRRQYITSQKEGGSLKNNDSFMKWVKYNRERNNDVDKKAIEKSKQYQKDLQLELTRLDRQTLLLLRSIFK